MLICAERGKPIDGMREFTLRGPSGNLLRVGSVVTSS